MIAGLGIFLQVEGACDGCPIVIFECRRLHPARRRGRTGKPIGAKRVIDRHARAGNLHRIDLGRVEQLAPAVAVIVGDVHRLAGQADGLFPDASNCRLRRFRPPINGNGATDICSHFKLL
jgi:hypothetical protein